MTTATLNRTEQFRAKAQEYCDLLEKLKEAEGRHRRATEDVSRLREHLTARQKDLGDFVGRNIPQRHAALSDGRNLVVTFKYHDNSTVPILPDLTVFGPEGEPIR